jgi:hypothetical protein
VTLGQTSSPLPVSAWVSRPWVSLFETESIAEARSKGKACVERNEYVVQDGAGTELRLNG